MEIIMLVRSPRFLKWIPRDKSEFWTSPLALAFGICVKSYILQSAILIAFVFLSRALEMAIEFPHAYFIGFDHGMIFPFTLDYI